MELAQLLEGNLVITHRLTDASNATLYGEVEGYGPVIYKPISGERPLWDFPHGTLADREVLTYKLSELLSFKIVPTTVMRDGPFGPGMVQEWIENDFDRDPIEIGESLEGRIRNLALFDLLINNADRKFGHILLPKSGEIYGCDHGLTFHEEYKTRTVIWQFAGQSLTPTEFLELENLLTMESAISEMMRAHITPAEEAAFFARARELKERGSFPFPDPRWPAVPWPPV
jgi:hypothetical protein